MFPGWKRTIPPNVVCNFSSVCSKIPQAFSPWKLTNECKHLYDGTKHTQEPKKSGDRRSRRTSTCDLLIERSCCPVSTHGHVHKWGRTASPEINIYIYSHLFLEKGAKNNRWGEGESAHQMVLGQLDTICKSQNRTLYHPRNSLKAETSGRCLR